MKLPKKYESIIEERREDKGKQLFKLIQDDCEPYMRKCDGYAKIMTEDKEITFTDYDNNECSITIKKGDYIVLSEDGYEPKIITAEDFEGKNEFMKGDKPMKKNKGPKIGIELMGGVDY